MESDKTTVMFDNRMRELLAESITFAIAAGNSRTIMLSLGAVDLAVSTLTPIIRTINYTGDDLVRIGTKLRLFKKGISSSLAQAEIDRLGILWDHKILAKSKEQ
jgi:hypothetical protein